MEFTYETANELKLKFNLTDKVVKIWETRGQIPNKYFQPGYTHKRPLTREEFNQAFQIKKLFRNSKLALSKLCLKIDMSYYTLANRLNTSTDFHPEEIQKIVAYLTQLRLDGLRLAADVKQTYHVNEETSEALKAFVSRPEINLWDLLGFYQNDSDYDRICHWRAGRIQISDQLKHKLADQIINFAVELDFNNFAPKNKSTHNQAFAA